MTVDSVATERPRCFISYSSEDRDQAVVLAKALEDRALDVWIDVLEILPGDSLVQKIFEEGLKDCRVCVILLSPKSVDSEWVKQELDVAVVNRLKKITRVIPVILKDCDVPVALRALRWLNMSDGVDRVADGIASTVYRKPRGVTDGAPPMVFQLALKPRAGLSQEAATAGAFIASRMSTDRYPDPLVEGQAIADETHLAPEALNDAVDELSANGLVIVHRFLGTHPFAFGMVQPTYALAFTFPDFVEGTLDPVSDVKQVAAVIVSMNEADGPALSQRLGFPPNRVNFCVAHLRDYGLIQTLDWLGSTPYSFGSAIATRSTREFVRANE